MRTRLGRLLGSFLILLLAAGCDGATPFDPSLAPTFRRADAPSGLALNIVAFNRIDVSWQDNSRNETGFHLFRAIGANETFSLYASTAPGVTGYSDGGLTGVTEYCYQVRAYRTTGRNTTFSDFSNTACATTPLPPVPAPPSGTHATPAFSTAVNVTWIDNSHDELGFRVDFSLDNGSVWQSAAVLSQNTTGFTHYDLTSDQMVCYRVAAFHSLGTSAPSDAYCTAPPFAPDQLTAAGVAPADIDLVWSDNSGVEDGYEVRQGFVECISYYYYPYCYTYYVPIATLAVNTESYRVSGLNPGEFYTFVVVATKQGGYSSVSNEAGSYPGPAVP